MNAIIQALFHCSVGQMVRATNSVLSSLFSEMNSNVDGYYWGQHLQKLVAHVRNQRQFQPVGSQHDAQEFFSWILGSLPAEIQRQFTFEHRQNTRCGLCGSCTSVSEAQHLLSIVDNSSVSKAIQQMVDCPEDLIGCNQYHCSKCTKAADARQWREILSPPDILVCHVKTQLFTKGKVCVEEHVSLKTETGTFKYGLKSMIIHRGRSVESGHYFACCRVSDTTSATVWKKFDDHNVTTLSTAKQHQLMSGSDTTAPYLLFYQLANSTNKAASMARETLAVTVESQSLSDEADKEREQQMAESEALARAITVADEAEMSQMQCTCVGCTETAHIRHPSLSVPMCFGCHNRLEVTPPDAQLSVCSWCAAATTTENIVCKECDAKFCCGCLSKNLGAAWAAEIRSHAWTCLQCDGTELVPFVLAGENLTESWLQKRRRKRKCRTSSQPNHLEKPLSARTKPSATITPQRGSAAAASAAASLLGRQVRKRFGARWFHGYVVEFDHTDGYWLVIYSDGDTEEYTTDELHVILQPIATSAHSPAQCASAGPKSVVGQHTRTCTLYERPRAAPGWSTHDEQGQPLFGKCLICFNNESLIRLRCGHRIGKKCMDQ
jgi:hypothetical protein